MLQTESLFRGKWLHSHALEVLPQFSKANNDSRLKFEIVHAFWWLKPSILANLFQVGLLFRGSGLCSVVATLGSFL